MEKQLAYLRAVRQWLAANMAWLVDSRADGMTTDELAQVRSIGSDIDSIDSQIGELEALRDQRARQERRALSLVDTPQPTETSGAPDVRVGDEPLTYSRESGHQFFRDAYRAQFHGDRQAQERLDRHSREMETELRDVGTGAFAGLVVPQYLTDEYAALARAGRVTANICRGLPLPDDGMTLNISRITTGTATAVQATENAAVQETDIDDTLLTVNVRTIAGQQDVSRQALERGTMIDSVVMGDLAADYAVKLDTSIISDDGTAGTHLGILSTSGINTVTYTDATPTVAEAFPKVADAIQQVNSGRYFPADAIVMHPRRWGWFTAAVDTTNRPLVVPNSNAPWNAVGVGDPAGYGGPVGTLFGLPVYTDANIPTNLGAGNNEDRILVVRSQDLILWEEGSGAPRQLRFEETLGGNLTVKLVVYGFSAFTAGRYPEAVAVISGTGLVTPTF